MIVPGKSEFWSATFLALCHHSDWEHAETHATRAEEHFLAKEREAEEAIAAAVAEELTKMRARQSLRAAEILAQQWWKFVGTGMLVEAVTFHDDVGCVDVYHDGKRVGGYGVSKFGTMLVPAEKP